MSTDVIPSHLDQSREFYDGNAFFNVRLRVGEVQAIYWPTHPKNVSKKRVEYDVFTSHRANGTAVTKMYNHVSAMDLFGGLADTGTQTYRPDPAAARQDANRAATPGMGSKVLMLCVNGESNQAFIIGGIGDMNADADDETLGHHLHRRFNGIDLLINKDGELIIEYQGAQKADGSLEDGVDVDATGTTITISKNGNVEIADAVQDGDDVVAKNIILLDHENGKVHVTAQNEATIEAPKVRQGGPDASQPDVLGNKWKSMMEATFDAIAKIQVSTPMGPSSIPLNTPDFIQQRRQPSPECQVMPHKM